MPNTIVAAANRIATAATSGWASASASGDQPAAGFTRRRAGPGISISKRPIHITATTRR